MNMHMYAYAQSNSNKCIVFLRDVKDILHLS